MCTITADELGVNVMDEANCQDAAPKSINGISVGMFGSLVESSSR